MQVKWHDTFTMDDWLTIEQAELLEPLECTSTGYLVAQTKDYIVLAQTLSAHGKCFASVAIPHANVIKVVEDED